MDVTAAGDLSQGGGLAPGVVVTVFLAGLRHGFDIDHVAAIGDITSSQTDRRRALLLATTYALGHMSVLLALGVAAVFAGKSIPPSVDALAGRVIGATLVALGVYVVYSLIRFRRDFRMRSRLMLVVAGVRRVLQWIRPPRYVVIEHEHDHPADGHHGHASRPPAAVRGGRAVTVATVAKTHAHSHEHVVPMPADPFTDYGVKTSLLVGMVHGVGAETPTQVLLFTTAAGVAGTFGGIALVAAFALGLLAGNSILALLTSAGFVAGKRLPFLYAGLATVTAIVSVYVGATYLLGRPDVLPGFLGG